MNLRRRIIYLGSLATALAGLNLWAYSSMIGARERASQAGRDADLSEQLESRILTLKSQPAVAGTKEQAQQELSQEIESIARSFGVTGDNLASIDPDPAVRAADTAYLEKPTTVQLRGIMLTQLAEIICKISAMDKGLRIKSLRLSTPPDQKSEDLWSVELTLTYLIYSPMPVQHVASERS